MPETEKFKEVVVAECVIYLKVYLKQAEFLIHGKSPGGHSSLDFAGPTEAL